MEAPQWPKPPEGPAPLSPTLDWGEPTDVVTLYEGPMRIQRGGHSSLPRPGRVRLLLRSGASVVWDVDLEDVDHEQWRLWRYRRDAPEPALVLESLAQGGARIPALLTGDGRGILHGLAPDGASPIAHVVRAVCFCLPALAGAVEVVERHEDGSWASWTGRHTIEVLGWEVIIEDRKDLAERLSEAKREHLFVGTHVIQIRRSDGEQFDGLRADQMLTGLTYGLSFALGRWVALVHAQGFSADGEALWTEWGAPHVETPGRGSTRWWNTLRTEDLIAFLQLWMSRWLQGAKRQPLRFLVTSALAAGETAFVEQRLLTVMAALEHYWWAFGGGRGLQLGPKLHQDEGEASLKVRRLLKMTGVPRALPVKGELGEYAREHQLVDTAHALTYIRNRLTHPKVTEQLYEREGLVAEAALLARRYLDLVLLWELGYQGHACDGTVLNRWAGESDQVPWTRGAGDPSQ